MISRLTRLSERDRTALDRGLSAVLFVVMVAELSLGHHRGSLVLELLIAAIVAAALMFRRQHALLVVAVTAAGVAVLFTSLTSPNGASTVIIALIVSIYSAGAHLELRRALLGCAISTATIATVCILESPNDIFFPLVFFGIVPWVVGRAIRTQTALARELAEKADAEQVAREREEARAKLAERARVARELHDVLAHNLSVMVIQASAARRVLDQDPQAALEAGELITRTGRETLNELRYLFGPVRRQDGDVLGAPGLDDLDQLVSRAHRSGLPADLRIEGSPTKLSPGADLAAYRVIQEALTNTLKHSHGARATVTVRYGSGEVILEVLDDGGGSETNGQAVDGGGHGLVGMRERVALYGGELKASKRREGGFAVQARLPLGGRST